MKALLTSALLLALGSVTGCVSETRALALGPVGPPPLPSASAPSSGSLVVYSALDPNAHFNSLPYADFYTGYKLLSPDGTVLQSVPNNPSPSVSGPTTVKLPAGAYRIVARANGYGTVAVPVVIRPGQTTTVHLEGGSAGTSLPVTAQEKPVRLPDGQIVGWRADPNNTIPTPATALAGNHNAAGPANPEISHSEVTHSP